MSFERQFDSRHASLVNQISDSFVLSQQFLADENFLTTTEPLTQRMDISIGTKPGLTPEQQLLIAKIHGEASCRKDKLNIRSKQNMGSLSSKPNNTSSVNNYLQQNLCVTFQSYQYQVCMACFTIPVLHVAAPQKSCEKCNPTFMYLFCALIRSNIPIADNYRSKNIACPSCERHFHHSVHQLHPFVVCATDHLCVFNPWFHFNNYSQEISGHDFMS